MVEPWRADILALRAHTLVVIGATQGIISFPSFHTICAVLLANMARGRRWLTPLLALNLLMILSVMSEGAHYAVDILSGVLVAFAAIVFARRMIAALAAVTPVPALAAPQGPVVLGSR
jgi:membrane-associated phospholipid phosphatase